MNEPEKEELIYKSDEDKYPTSWSSDGQFLLYTAVNKENKTDLWILPLQEDAEPYMFIDNPEFNEEDGHFSPDMRWIAYTSDRSGRNEIYVRSSMLNEDESSTSQIIPISNK